MPNKTTEGASEPVRDLVSLLCCKSREILEKAEKDLGGSGPESHLAKGYVFELVGYFEAAVSAYAEAFAQNAHLLEARVRQALCHLKAGHPELGLEVAIAAAGIDEKLQLTTLATGETFSVLTVLGDALVANNRMEDAIEAFKKARILNPDDNYATTHLAQVYLATNRQSLAADLGTSIKPPTRFEGFKTVLSLGSTSLALLPSSPSRTAVVASMRTAVPGRPMDVHGEQRFASIEDGKVEWCANVTDFEHN